VAEIVSPEIRCIGIRCIGGAYSQVGKRSQASDRGLSVAAVYGADVKHAHLTVISSHNVNTHEGKYYSDKSEDARSGVDLPNGIDESSAQT
jgi:hypothetical protein